MLTDSKIRTAPIRPEAYKVPDSGSLYLLVRPSGSKTFIWKYRFAGKEKSLTIGPYPMVSLKEARATRDRARLSVGEGIDPSFEKQRRRAEALMRAEHTFEETARRWYAAKLPTWVDRTAKAVLRQLELHAFPAFGKYPIADLTPVIILSALRKIEKRGTHDVTRRVKQHIVKVFDWAIAEGLVRDNPAERLGGALKPVISRNRKAFVDLEKARGLLRATEARSGVFWTTLLASRLLALTAARPGVVQQAEATEFEGLDGPEPVWRVPAAKMKQSKRDKADITREFIIPLSRQAADVARAAIATSQACIAAREYGSDQPQWLFHGPGAWRRPLSNSTLSKLYRESGFEGLHDPHGWRATFSTLMNDRIGRHDLENDQKIIDLMLAHAQPGVEPIYNRSSYSARRREIAQQWADILMEGMPGPETLLPDVRPWRAREPGHEPPSQRTARRRGSGGTGR